MDDRDKCTILVCSCDAYDDLWDPFFKLFKIYWSDCPYRIILNAESKVYKMDGINVECMHFYKSGEDVPYGERLLKHLAQINTPYVLVILDDFFFQREVNTEDIRKVISYLDDNSEIAMFKLSPNRDSMNIKDDRFPEYERRPRYGEYRHSLQIAVWRTDYFMKTWKKKESPWDWEIWGTYRSIDDGWEYYCLREDSRPPIDYGYDFDKGGSLNVYRGKWTHDSYEKIFEKNGIEVDFDKRGWYKDEKIHGADDSFINKEIRRLRSAGIKMYLKIFAWRICKYVDWKRKKPVNKTYMDYLRNKDKEYISSIKF